MLVTKFGGTSVGDAQRLAAAARIVADKRRAGERPVVVTSAMAGVTDRLASLLGRAGAGDRDAVVRGVEQLRVRHLAAGQALAPGDAALAGRIELHLRRLRVALRGVRLMRTASARKSDEVLGAGELLAQELFAAALGAAGVAAEVVDAREVVVTDTRFGSARPDLAATGARARARLAPLAERGVVPVLGGFLGATPDGLPTTLGRGGSDLSATVLGHALGAREVEIWTDVDGLMTADPKLVPQARTIGAATFREAAALAAFGARVLHERAVDPALLAGIPVRIRNAFAPQRPGTRLGARPAGGADRPSAIACRSPVEIVRYEAPGRAGERGMLGPLAEAMERGSAPPLGVALGAGEAELLLPAGSLGGRSAGPWPDAARRSGLAVVAVVGEALVGRPELWRAILRTADGTPVERVLQGPGALSLSLVVPEQRAHGLVRRLHGAWIESAPVRDALGGGG